MRTIFVSRARRGVLALAGSATLAAACARNPVTGRNQLSLISEEQEIAMGRQAAQEVAQSLGLVANDTLQAYVQRIGADLAAESERPELPWSFRVVEDPTPNAFALPGGFIFVTRGLLNLMDSEAELASVLGHEIGHVTAKHQVTALSRQQAAQLGLGVGMILSDGLARYGELANTGLGLLFLKYGRDAENQADQLGFKYALEEGYDVREMADVFRALARAGEAAGQSPLPSWLATHPYPEERIRRTEERLAALDRPLTSRREGEADYMTRIDGLVYGENPRNGFFENGVFIHPELRFTLAFPRGWRTQNLTESVVAASPQNDAAVQLTLSPQPDPVAGARAFLAQQGVQAGRTFQEPVNGIPAAGSYFQAQTQQGVVQGLVAFFAYGGRTYQLLSYAPEGRFEQYDALLRQSLGSFRPLTDPRLLAAQPNRIDVVRLAQPMTLAEFMRRHSSAASPAEVALINQVDGPGAEFPAGALLKRVVPAGAG